MGCDGSGLCVGRGMRQAVNMEWVMHHQMKASCVLGSVLLAGFAGLSHAQPQYTIVDMGILDLEDIGVQGSAVSENGNATGRTLGASNQAFSWSQSAGIMPLPNEPTRPFGRGNGINDAGTVVGTGSTTFFGSSPLPLIWNSGVVSILPLPAGQTLARANDINSAGVAVGSAGGGSNEVGVIYDAGNASIITQTTPNGSFIRTAFAINDDGLVVGFGIDPNNAARNVGFVYDSVAGVASEVGALPGHNGALAFGVSNAGHVVGASMLNQGAGTPFIWTQADGMTEIPLPPATSSGSARGVNSSGWAVGNAGGLFAVPFLYDGTTTYALQDLIPAGSGWDLSMNTSSSAEGISESGIIVGSAELFGQVHAYAMIPVCLPDTNHDGNLTPADFTAWIAAFNAGAPECDQNSDGNCDPSDFTAWIANFNAGCN